MRLPWPDVADRTLADVRSGAPERRGVRDAVADLSGALRAREVLPSRVVDDIRSLRRAAAG